MFRVQKMSTLLRSKEDSLRKLKEKICKSQRDADKPGEFANGPRFTRGLKEEDRSFSSDPDLSNSVQQGKDSDTKVTNPRGWVTRSSFRVKEEHQEEEVQQLHIKIGQLERLGHKRQPRSKVSDTKSTFCCAPLAPAWCPFRRRTSASGRANLSS